MTGIPPSAYAPMRVKCSHRWSRAICSRSFIAGMFPVAVIPSIPPVWSARRHGWRWGFRQHYGERCVTTPALDDDVGEHQRDRNEEDHRSDHVDLWRHRDARGAPHEERE